MMMKGIKAIILLVTVSILFVNVQCVQEDIHTAAESVLFLIHDCLEKAIQDCGLGEKLELTSAFSACKTLHQLRKSAVGMHIKNEKISHNIIQCVNERLMRNPALLTFLKNFNDSLIVRHQLSENEIAIILKNSALLVPIDEIYSLAEIIRIVQGIDKLALSPQRLNVLLQEVGLDRNDCALRLWQQKQRLIEMYEFWQRAETTLSEKIKCTKLMYRVEKNMKIIFAALGITDEYAEMLKPLDVGGLSHKRMDDLFEDAFDGQTERWNIKAYALAVEKNIRAECR